jgi:vitamin B12 transport system permease protein
MADDTRASGLATRQTAQHRRGLKPVARVAPQYAGIDAIGSWRRARLACNVRIAVASAAAQPFPPQTMPAAQRRSKTGLLIGFATAVMSALAAGAVWSVLVLRTGYDLTFLAIVIALVIAWILRINGYAGMRTGALLAALCTALACVYAQCLLAVGDVAQAMGFSLRETILRIGAGFMIAVARGRISPWQSGTYVLAMAIAAWLVWRRPRKRGVNGRDGVSRTS